MIHLLSFEPYITSLASVVFALVVLATFEFEMDLCAGEGLEGGGRDNGDRSDEGRGIAPLLVYP